VTSGQHIVHEIRNFQATAAFDDLKKQGIAVMPDVVAGGARQAISANTCHIMLGYIADDPTTYLFILIFGNLAPGISFLDNIERRFVA
jgi:hypothetical protein